jgi:hypothetical protein
MRTRLFTVKPSRAGAPPSTEVWMVANPGRGVPWLGAIRWLATGK